MVQKTLRVILPVVFISLVCGSKAQCAWQTIGQNDSNQIPTDYYVTDLALNDSGVPYVLCNSKKPGVAPFSITGNANVLKCMNNRWQYVGNRDFMPDTALFSALSIDKNGIPYALFRDVNQGDKATVMKLNGASWTPLGNAGFSPGKISFCSLAIDTNNQVYAAFADAADSNKIIVMSYSGSNWSQLASAITGAYCGSPNCYDIPNAIYFKLKTDPFNVPYLVYTDATGIVVKKYTGSVWVPVGSIHFSAGQATDCDITFDLSGTPYVVYKDYAVSQRATAMKFNGTSWTVVGTSGFSMLSAENARIEVDNTGTPYVLIDPTGTYAPYVYKFNGTSWIQAGPLNPFASSEFSALRIDKSGTPFITAGNEVLKYNGGSWVILGDTGIASSNYVNTNIALDSLGAPYIAYSDYTTGGDKLTVLKGNGTSWQPLGPRGISAGKADFIDLAFVGEKPYVAFSDFANGKKVSVMTYNGSWQYVGSAGFSGGQADYVKITSDATGNLYVAYSDYTHGKAATVMKFNGTNWTSLGSAGFSPGQAAYTDILIDILGNPYVAFVDYAHSQKASVMKYNGSSWVPFGTYGISAGQSAYTSLAADKLGNIYVGFMDYATNTGITVKKYNGAWATVGNTGFAGGKISSLTLATDSNDILVALYSYQDTLLRDVGAASKFTGSSWIKIGGTNFSAGYALSTSMAIGKDNSVWTYYYNTYNVPNQVPLVAWVKKTDPDTLIIASQPVSYTACINSAASFSVSVNGTGLYYQWQEEILPGIFTDLTSSANYSGVSSQLLTVTNFTAQFNNKKYRCIINSACGTAISNSATLTLLNKPVVTAGPVRQNTCPGWADTLIASGAVQYAWNIGGTNDTAIVYPSANTTYTVVGTDGNGCTDTVSFVLNMMNVSVSVTDTTSCGGAPDTLHASGALTYTWNTGFNGPKYTVSPTSTTSYTVIGTDVYGCSDTATTTIHVNPVTAFTVTASKPAICANRSDTITLSSIPGLTYGWQPSANVAWIVYPYKVKVSPQATTTYTVYGTNSFNCTDSVIFTVQVNPLPVITFTSSGFGDTVCVNSGLYAITGASPAGGQYTGLGVNGNTFDASQVPPGMVNLFYWYTDQNGCQNSAMHSIYVAGCTSETKAFSSKINVYPNPSEGIFTLNDPDPGHFIEVFDAIGQKIYTGPVHNLDLRQEKSNLFYLRVLNSESIVVETKVLMKQ